MTVTRASLCTGYGGLDMAAVAGIGVPLDTLWHAEVNPDACTVLGKRFPGVPNVGDITAADWSRWPRPHLLTMGPPCQPVSAAGRQLATNDARWLWPACAAAVSALRPTLVVFENVRNLISIQGGSIWRSILADLRGLGHAVRWTVVGACAVGACHHRHRVFLMAARMRGPAPEAVRVDAIECGAPRTGGRALLPTPTAVRYGNNRGGSAGRTGPVRYSLDSIATLLPTPVARDGDPSGRGEGSVTYWRERVERTGRTEGVPLGAAVRLLPTPRHSDVRNGGPNQGIASDDSAGQRDVTGERWGVYADAVALWQEISGRPVPDPTEPNSRGTGVRLASALPEWMMDLDAGCLTDVVDRSAALRLAGNGVHVSQGAAALRVLLP